MTTGVIAVHDISCFGRCSLTVALPIISSCGVGCTVLPTALLSTHTGGFTNPYRIDLTESMMPIYKHWCSQGLRFDGIYTGYLGSPHQPDILLKIFNDLSSNGTRIFVDPVLGDNGRMYSGITDELVCGLRRMVSASDLVMPNITEACLLLGIDYREPPHDKKFIEMLIYGLKDLGCNQVVITGICPNDDTIEVSYIDLKGQIGSYVGKRTPGSYHGSGDMFGSVLVGRMIAGDDLASAIKRASDFVAMTIASTLEAGTQQRNGLCFEGELWRLCDCDG